MQPAAHEEPAPQRAQELGVYRDTLDDTELVLLAQQFISVGALREALELCESCVGTSSVRGVRLCEARARFGLGQKDAAFALLNALLDSEPRDALATFYKGQLLAQSGQGEAARLVLRGLIDATPDFPAALPTLAQLSFPGPPYREVLRRIHDGLRPHTYLEIGVEHGATLALAVHSQVVCGVDPMPRRASHRLPTATRLFDMTSDAFFASDVPEQVFGRRRIDLAFIDGMHLFEFVLRDFCNVERWCHPGSTVVLHDCLPVAEVAALRERRTSFWVGDVWKAVECLLCERPDLRIEIVPCYPSGLVILSHLDPHAVAFAGRLASLESRYRAMPYSHPPQGWPAHYPMVANREPELTELISSLASAALPHDGGAGHA